MNDLFIQGLTIDWNRVRPYLAGFIQSLLYLIRSLFNLVLRLFEGFLNR